MRPYDGLSTGRVADIYGIRQRHVGDMCVHMFDMVRWMLELGWRSITSTGGILVHKAGKANISDTQTATFDYGDFDIVWQHRTWGQSPTRSTRGAHLLR